MAYDRPTFRRIVRNKSTEDFSVLPYIYSLLNCLICLWYGLPWVSHDVILIATVNSIGAIFQLVYVSIFIANASSHKRVIEVLFAVFLYNHESYNASWCCLMSLWCWYVYCRLRCLDCWCLYLFYLGLLCI